MYKVTLLCSDGARRVCIDQDRLLQLIKNLSQNRKKTICAVYTGKRFYEIEGLVIGEIKGLVTPQRREKEQEKLLCLSKVEDELRNLMDIYIMRQEKLQNEIEEAKQDGDIDGVLTGEALYRQMRHVVAELFQTMKRVGILDEGEIALGCVKK